jgi:hypothetical protein
MGTPGDHRVKPCHAPSQLDHAAAEIRTTGGRVPPPYTVSGLGIDDQGCRLVRSCPLTFAKELLQVASSTGSKDVAIASRRSDKP